MKDFFEQFKENLENRPEPKYEGRLWERLNRDLDMDGKKKRTGFGWWWMLGAFCFALLGSNIFSLLELQKVNQKFTNLQQKTDTIYINNDKTQIVYQKDTILQTKIIREEVIRYIATAATTTDFNSFLTANQMDQNFWSKQAADPITNQSTHFENFSFNDLLAQHIYKTNNDPVNRSDNKSDDQNGMVLFSSLLDLPFLDTDVLDGANTFSTKGSLLLSEKKKNKRKLAAAYLYAMRPKGLDLGLSVGYANIQNKDLKNKIGYSVGLNTAITFSPKFQLWVNANYFKMDLKSRNFNNTTPGPSEDPPVSANYEFSVAEANPSFLKYSIGLQYFFNEDKRWKPFVGLGYSSESYSDYKFTYEYLDPTNTSLEWNTDEHIKEQTINDLLLFRLGLEYEISDHWYWQSKLDYSRDFKNRKLLAPALLNLQTGFNYRF